MLFGKLFSKFSKDIAIDLGTTNTLVYVKDRGIVVKESSIVTINTKTDEIVAVGEEAHKMLGKTPPHLIISKPLVNGVISDFEVTEKMLKYFINRVNRENFGIAPRPRVIIGIPLDVTEVEKKAVEDAVFSAGAREVFLVENIVAAAVGARLPIQDASGNMVIDIGGGITEIAVISLSGVVAWKSLKVAGEEFDQNIIQFAKNEFNLLIGERVAEQLKLQASQIKDSDKIAELRMRGRDLISGLPKEIPININQIDQAVERSIKIILENIKTTLEITPPELIADIYQRGMVLTGGGSLFKGLAEIISEVTKIPVRIVDDPLTCTVRGMGLILEDENFLKEIAIPSTQDEKVVR